MTKYILLAIAILGICIAIFVVIRGGQEVTPAEPIAKPSSVPYASFIAGSGIIESASTDVNVSAPKAGLAMIVYVQVGEKVKKGQPLVELDTRHLVALHQIHENDIAVAEATVRVTEAKLADSQSQLELAEKVQDKRAISVDELDRRRFAVDAAEAELDKAEAQIRRHEAQLEATKVEIERMIIRAPMDGEILQINIDPGEYANVIVGSEPLMVMGDTNKLAVRVDIDENDAWRFVPDSPAVGVLRGNSSLVIPLKYKTTEPLIIPRKQLSGETSQKIDQRVLQVLYDFNRNHLPVYIGQQVDVWVEVPTKPSDKEEGS